MASTQTQSFSQCGEDKIFTILLQLIFKKTHSFTYLDIGSNHPSINNNTYRFYLNGGSGVLVEPNPHYAKITSELRPHDIFYSAGISIDDKQQATYYMFEDTGLNTFNSDVLNLIDKNIPGLKLINKLTLPLININELLKKHFIKTGLDILSIDCEGYDIEILHTIDFSICRPKIICLEALTLWTIWQDTYHKFFKKHGYSRAASTYINDIFVDINEITDKAILDRLSRLFIQPRKSKIYFPFQVLFTKLFKKDKINN